MTERGNSPRVREARKKNKRRGYHISVGAGHKVGTTVTSTSSGVLAATAPFTLDEFGQRPFRSLLLNKPVFALATGYGCRWLFVSVV